MKIYKFKDLSDKDNHPHFFQILFENKIWCASPESLNDPDEFRFKMDYNPSERTESLLTKMVAKLGKSRFPPEMVATHAVRDKKLEEFTAPLIPGIIEQCRSTIGVTSFSSVGTGAKLWEKYGGSGNGIAVEFEVSDRSLGNTFHPVEYVPERVFHVDIFIESQIGNSSAIFKNVLCTKTREWVQEQEIRFLGKNPNINFTLESPITKITLGHLVSPEIAHKVVSHCDQKGIDVERA